MSGTRQVRRGQPDSVCLASEGLEVTALDVTRVALHRASSAGDAAGLKVPWIRSGLLQAEMTPEGSDLVSAPYRPFPGTPEHAAERMLIGMVAAGDQLIVVHHADPDSHDAHATGFDRADDVSPGNAAALIDDGCEELLDLRRPRPVTGGGAPSIRVATCWAQHAGDDPYASPEDATWAGVRAAKGVIGDGLRGEESVAGALAVATPWPAAGSALAFLELLFGPTDTALPGHVPLGIFDPADELVPGEGRDVHPGVERRGIGDERSAEVRWQFVDHATGHAPTSHAIGVHRVEYGAAVSGA